MTGNGEEGSPNQSDAPGDPIPEFPPELLGDRERGLSKTDREYLAKGGEAMDKQVEINTRSRIRKRIRESIVDFWLISSYLSEHDRDLVFRENREQMSNWKLQIGLKSAMQFFYSGLNHSDLADFDTVLTSAIHDAERREYKGPVLVDVDFDVEVDEQFRVEEAYDKFQRGVPLDPTEIGVLLVTGRVHDEKEIERLARHARSNGFLESSIAPLLGEQLAEFRGEDEPVQAFRYTLAHLTDTEFGDAPVEGIESLSSFQYLEEERRLAEEELDVVKSVEDLADEELAEKMREEWQDQYSDSTSGDDDGGDDSGSDGSSEDDGADDADGGAGPVADR